MSRSSLDPPDDPMRSPDDPLRHPVDRRRFLALGATAAAVSMLGSGLLGAEPAAAATVTWGHPFAYRQPAGSRFGMRRGRMHQGQDYAAAVGTPVHAVADGVVSHRGVLGTNGAYGNAVFVSHAGGWSSRYAHLRAPSTLTVGQRITRGRLIGYVGNTGRSTGPHLHLEVRKNGSAVDPYPLVQNAPLANATTAAAAPLPSPIPIIEDDMAYSITADGHYYTIAPQFICHHGSMDQATTARNVTSAKDEFHVLSSAQFTHLLDGFGIPREAVRPGAVLDPQAGTHRAGGVWSREREILASLAKLAA